MTLAEVSTDLAPDEESAGEVPLPQDVELLPLEQGELLVSREHAVFCRVPEAELAAVRSVMSGAMPVDALGQELLDDLGNLVRTLTKTPYGLVFISEAKHKLENESNVATVFISPDFQKAYRIGTLPNPYNIKTGFVYSQGSMVSIGDKFFTSNDNILPGGRLGKMLEWRILLN